MREKIEEKVLELGITPNLLGFSYICDAVEYVVETGNYGMGDIYYNVALKHEYANTQRVERAIRHAITKVSRDMWRGMGGKGMRNSEFVYTLAWMMKKEGKEND